MGARVSGDLYCDALPIYLLGGDEPVTADALHDPPSLVVLSAATAVTATRARIQTLVAINAPFGER